MRRPLPPPSDRPPQLQYAPPPPWHRRKAARRIAIGILVLLTLTVFVKLTFRAARHASLLYWQDKAMSYTAPPDRVVSGRRPLVNSVCQEWDKFYELLSPGGTTSADTLFLHERTSPSGNRRLVAVHAYRMPVERQHGLTPIARLFIPATPASPPREIITADIHQGVEPAVLDYKQNLIIYAGQPEPADASHFTISAVVDGQDKLIDGWLRDDDTLVLELRRPPTSAPASTTDRSAEQPE